MKSKTTRMGQYWVVTCEGEIDGPMFGSYPGVMPAIMSGAKNIILDLSGIETMTASGIRALTTSIRIAQQREVALGVISRHDEIKRAMKSSALTQSVALYEDHRHAAMKLNLPDVVGAARYDPMDKILIWQGSIPLVKEIRETSRKYPVRPGLRFLEAINSDDAIEQLRKGDIEAFIADGTIPPENIIGFFEKYDSDNGIRRVPIILIADDNEVDKLDPFIRNRVSRIIEFPSSQKEMIPCIHITISKFLNRCETCKKCQYENRPWLLKIYSEPELPEIRA